ncbi:hypothetical protein [Paraburkholderia sp. DGU8]|uniref:hypothetical protein n=1 Tax=Paraburkholderia sp. DGU8 TaxID=3161997 RepID=UPI003466778A
MNTKRASRPILVSAVVWFLIINGATAKAAQPLVGKNEGPQPQIVPADRFQIKNMYDKAVDVKLLPGGVVTRLSPNDAPMLPPCGKYNQATLDGDEPPYNVKCAHRYSIDNGKGHKPVLNEVITGD